MSASDIREEIGYTVYRNSIRANIYSLLSLCSPNDQRRSAEMMRQRLVRLDDVEIPAGCSKYICSHFRGALEDYFMSGEGSYYCPVVVIKRTIIYHDIADRDHAEPEYEYFLYLYSDAAQTAIQEFCEQYAGEYAA